MSLSRRRRACGPSPIILVGISRRLAISAAPADNAVRSRDIAALNVMR
jgi:hypothetical protein